MIRGLLAVPRRGRVLFPSSLSIAAFASLEYNLGPSLVLSDNVLLAIAEPLSSLQGSQLIYRSRDVWHPSEEVKTNLGGRLAKLSLR